MNTAILSDAIEKIRAWDVATQTGVISAALAVIAILVAYHIAIRTGTFLRPWLDVQIGPPLPEPHKYKLPIAVIYGIPKKFSKRHVLLTIPILIKTRSHAIKSLWIQISLPALRGDVRLSDLVRLPEEYPPNPGKRRSLVSGGRHLVEYEIQTLQQNQTLTIHEPLIYFSSEIVNAPVEPNGNLLEDVIIDVRAENHKGIRRSVLIGAFWSNSMEFLQETTLVAGISARIRRNRFVIYAKNGSAIFLPAPHSIWMNRLCLIQTNPIETLSPLSISRFDSKETEYNSAEFLPVFVRPRK